MRVDAHEIILPNQSNAMFFTLVTVKLICRQT